MIGEPSREALDRLPRLYQTEAVPIEETVIHLHFFIGACDWWAAEFDGEDLFFGFVCLGDPINAEWGYFRLSELRDTRVVTELRDGRTGEVLGKVPVEVEFDAFWRPRPFGEVREEKGFL